MANERLLILGGNSFLGLHLTRDLAAKYNTTPTYLTNRPSDFNFVRCNLLSKPDLHSLGQFDYVIQYSSIIAGSNKKQQNLEMVRNAVEYANTTQAKYIYISSSQVNFTIDSDYRQSKIEAERPHPGTLCELRHYQTFGSIWIPSAVFLHTTATISCTCQPCITPSSSPSNRERTIFATAGSCHKLECVSREVSYGTNSEQGL